MAKDAETDPLKINHRLYKQLGLLLDEMEKHELDITFPQRLNALVAVARIQTVFMSLRLKEKNDDDELAGSAVRDAAKAFKTHGNGRGKKSPRSAIPAVFDDDDDFDAEAK